MQGKRLPDNKYPENPGEYSKIITEKGTFWFCIPPLGKTPGNLSAYEITEHEDKTITCDGVITYAEYNKGVSWYGHLIKGVWHEG